MASDMQLLSSVPFSIGFLCLVLGYMIRRRRGLIAIGYEPTTSSSPRGFCNWVGTHLVILGMVSVFSGVLVLFFPDAGIAVLLSFAFLIVVFTSSAAVGVTRFEGPRLEKKT